MTSLTKVQRAVLLSNVPARAIQTSFVDVHDPVGQNLSANLPYLPKPDLALSLSGHIKPILQSLARKKGTYNKTNRDNKKEYIIIKGRIYGTKRSNCLQGKKRTPRAKNRGM